MANSGDENRITKKRILDKVQVVKVEPEAEISEDPCTSAIYYDDVCLNPPYYNNGCIALDEIECESKTPIHNTHHVNKGHRHSIPRKSSDYKEIGYRGNRLDGSDPVPANALDNFSQNNNSSANINDDSEPLPHILHDLEEELERELEMKAEKTNLTAWNVKNMIKAVITDSEVMKMVDYSLQKSNEKPAYELKLTRAKTKELQGLDQNALWNIPVASPKKSDIEVLITQDLPEDSSDEEYEPQDELSDEESKASEGILEDDVVDLDISTHSTSNLDHSISDENIGQRTRSKLSLSETPLEAIEQSFIPPDITTDMYDTHCDNVDWLNFLKEFMQPLDSNQPETVDDDNDPEYNVMIDEEHEDADTEELRQDRAVKVTKKELNDLMSELAEYTEMLSSDEDEGNGKVEGGEDTDENTETPSEEAEAYTTSDNQFSEAQCLLLRQQLQQHVQLLTQSYLLSYEHPFADESYAKEIKNRLVELAHLHQMRTSSFFNILNLDSSINLINEWNVTIRNPSSHDIKRFMKDEFEKVNIYKRNKVNYRPKLPSELIMCCLKSDAFIYPPYLPPGGFSTFTFSRKATFNHYEDQLIAMGLEQFSNLLGSDLDNRNDLMEVVGYIKHLLIPIKSEKQIIIHIKKQMMKPDLNPIKVFFETKKAPEVKHYVVVHKKLNVLSNNSSASFPENWLKYL